MTQARLMEISESIKWIDDRIFAQTGKRLDSLQISILEATSQGQKYPQIAEKYNFTNDHVRKAAWKLWKRLSDVLGESVNQSNFRTLIQRGFFSNSNHNTINSNNNINLCSDRYHSEETIARSPTPPQPYPDTRTEPQINLDDAPAILTCYDSPSGDSFASRITELNTLEHWIVQDRCRIVQLLGISGIGKTALSLRLIDQIKNNFDYIIYQTLCFSPTLETTLINLLEKFGKPQAIPQQIEGQISQLLQYLRQHQCLIILDDVQMLFSPGKFAGEYQPSLENYPLFFKRIAEIEHSSCFLLISAEQLQEFTQLSKGDRPVRSLLLGGLGIAAREIFQQHTLSDETDWERLINTYQGNRLWLALTARMIQELFAGKVSEFLECEGLILADTVRSQIERQWQQLTQIEQAIMMQLKDENLPVTLPQILKTVSQQSRNETSDVLTAIQSLRRRFLMDMIDQGKDKFFKLNPVYQQYLSLRSS